MEDEQTRPARDHPLMDQVAQHRIELVAQVPAFSGSSSTAMLGPPLTVCTTTALPSGPGNYAGSNDTPDGGGVAGVGGWLVI
jgi:hypothetical protein